MSEKIVIYQVLPRLFGNKKHKNKENGTIEENGCGKFNAFSDKALEEIKKFGYTHIWYTGVLEHATKTDYSQYGIKRNHPAVVKGRAGSPYAVKDYYDVSPDLAENVTKRMGEFEDLLDRTHNAGLKVIMDFVPNHVAREYYSDSREKMIDDLGASDNPNMPFLPHNNFYYIKNEAFAPSFDLCDGEPEPYFEMPAKATGNDCFHAHPSRNDWYETIKLNYGVNYFTGERCFDPTPDTWMKMCDILLYWAAKGVDGFRCDMAEMVPVEFWHWAIAKVKEAFPDIIFIAEIYNPGIYRNFLSYGNFDYLYDKVGLYDTLRAAVRCETPTSNITYCWQQLEGIQEKMLNFLENHDEQRIASDFFAQNAMAGIPAAIVSATMNTNPFMIYFGQELGEPGMEKEGFSGLDGRTTIFDYWNLDCITRWINNGNFNEKMLTDSEKEIRRFYATLVPLLNGEKAIREGSFYDLMWLNYENPEFDSTRQYAFLRACGREVIMVVANFDTQDTVITVNITDEVFDFLHIESEQKHRTVNLLNKQDREEYFSKNIKVSIAAQSGKILKYKF